MARRSARGTPQWLGAVNDRATLEALLDFGSLTRNRICEIVDVSKPTATVIVGRLLDEELIREEGRASGSSGPSAVVYGPRLDRALGLAIDLDHRELRASIVDAMGSALSFVEIERSDAAGGRSAAAEVAAALAQAVAAAGCRPEAVSTACIGIPGYLDPGADGRLRADALPEWPTTGLRAELEDALGMPVAVENDVDLAALAERGHGQSPVDDDVVYLWLGNGVGMSFDVDGSAHRGASHGAGEIGFVELSVSAARLAPGAETVQDLVGGIGVIRLAQQWRLESADYTEAIDSLIASGRFAEIADDFAERIARILLPVLAVVDPHLVVIGGPTAQLGGANLADDVARIVTRESRWAPDVVTSTLPRPVHDGARMFAAARVREALLDSVAHLAGEPSPP